MSELQNTNNININAHSNELDSFLDSLSGLPEKEVTKAKELLIRNKITDCKLSAEANKKTPWWYYIPPFIIFFLLKGGQAHALKIEKEKIANMLEVWKEELADCYEELKSKLAQIEL